MPALCPGCFEREAPPSGDACPQCGYSADQDRSPLALPVHTELRDRYQVGRVLGEPGGFGVTYLAFDERLEIRVAIKEYVPRELAGRGNDGVSVVPYSTGDQEEFEYGLERFLGEAKALAQFDHANIVSVRDFFEENGTAYLVMDYYEGKTLKQYLQGQPEGRMDPEIGTEIMLRVLDGLKEVHSEGYLHRDIKPSNIYLTAEGRPILIDFGAARLALDEKSRSLSVVMTEGYAPYEQYRREGDQGPWTDVYGAGATLYRMITGEKPPPATDRVVDDTLRPPQELDPEVPEGLSRAITDALATGNKERPQSAEALQERLRGGLRGGPSEEETAEPQQREEPSRSPADVSEAPGEPSVPDGDNGYGAETSTEDNGAPWPSVFIGVLVVAALGLGGVAVALYPSGQEGGTIQLVEEARRHLDAGRLTSPEGTNALSAARQAVERNPGSEEAQKLLGQIADRLAEKGAEARRKGNLQAAMGFFERSLEIESQPKVRDELEAVGSRIREQYERLLSEMRSTLNEEAPTASELEAAAGAAREARKLRPEKGEAEKHLDQIASRAVGLGESAEASFQYGKAVRYYDQGLKLRGGAAVRKKLESARKIRAGRMPIRILHGHENTVNTAAFSLEESLLATGGGDGTARLWSAATGEQVQVLRGHEGWVSAVAFSPDGSLLATGSRDGTARLWSMGTGEQVQVLSGQEEWVGAVAFSPDGSQVATGGGDDATRLWSAQTGEEIQVLRGHEDVVTSVAFSPDGSQVATGSADGTARLWSAKAGEQFQILRGHGGTVYSVAFSPDGSRVATGSLDGTASLWSADTGDEVQVLREHEGRVSTVAFSPDGTFLATGSSDGTASLWSVDTGEEVRVLRGHEDGVKSVAFSSDGRLMATGSTDGMARLWYVPQEL